MGKDNKRNTSRRRLSWDESQEHYLALKEIENKYGKLGGHEDVDAFTSNNQRKKAEANIHNETRKYLQDNGLTYELGGFYVEE